MNPKDGQNCQNGRKFRPQHSRDYLKDAHGGEGIYIYAKGYATIYWHLIGNTDPKLPTPIPFDNGYQQSILEQRQRIQWLCRPRSLSQWTLRAGRSKTIVLHRLGWPTRRSTFCGRITNQQHNYEYRPDRLLR
jgi:hypothetical protein